LSIIRNFFLSIALTKTPKGVFVFCVKKAIILSMKISRKSAGFTLVEIITVIAIMGVLSAIVYGSFNSARAQSRDQRKVSDMSGIQLALETYFNQNHEYPTNLQTLVPQYIPSIPIPPMSDKYHYFPMGYNNAGPCISYQLWIKLETNNSTAISAKKGFNSTLSPLPNGMVYCGNGTADTVDATDLLTYDVVQ